MRAHAHRMFECAYVRVTGSDKKRLLVSANARSISTIVRGYLCVALCVCECSALVYAYIHVKRVCVCAHFRVAWE